MKTITLVSLILLCGVASTQAADGSLKSEETFSSVADGTPLDKLSAWSLHYGEGAVPMILMAAGYEGNGVRFTSKANFRWTLKSAAESAPQGHDLELRFKLRVMADSDAYVMSQVMLGQTGGVNGLYVRFNGGTKDGWEDNFIEVSSGGANWGKAKFKTVPDSHWRKGEWYEVIISDIYLIGAGEGAPVGKVRVKELDLKYVGAKTLVQDVPVACVGAGQFDQANVIIIGNAGSGRTFDVDDISLQTIVR